MICLLFQNSINQIFIILFTFTVIQMLGTMLGLNDIQYLYEFLFWFVTFLILKKVWHKPKVRLIYGHSVAILNILVIFFFSLSAIKGELTRMDAFAFGFLHAMVAAVMITLVRMSTKLEEKP